MAIRGGHVVDPANGVDGPRDVAVAGGRIAAVAEEVDPTQACAVHDARGRLVLPAVIDTEVHFGGSGGAVIGHRDLARNEGTTAVEFSDYRRVAAHLG
jgi:dihydroorotase